MPSHAPFAATRWSVVLAARAHSGSQARGAMEELAQAYWFPLYAFVRRQGETPAAAEDLVQEFFARLIEKKYLAGVDRSKGRFRSFLLAAMKHFMSNQRAQAHALKRGGGKIIALDSLSAEARYAVEPSDGMTPERLFDRRWALAVLDHVLQRLANEYASAGKAAIYQALEPCLTMGKGAADYSQTAHSLDMSESAVRVAAHRLRRRYRDLLRHEIAQTVDSASEVPDEISYLLSCL